MHIQELHGEARYNFSCATWESICVERWEDGKARLKYKVQRTECRQKVRVDKSSYTEEKCGSVIAHDVNILHGSENQGLVSISFLNQKLDKRPKEGIIFFFPFFPINFFQQWKVLEKRWFILEVLFQN